MLTAGVASADEAGSVRLQACLQQTGLVESVVEWNLLAEQPIRSGDAVPDVVLIELPRDPAAALVFAANLRRLRPTVCIIACAEPKQITPELLMQAMRSGVREFLHRPVEQEAIRDALERLTKEHGLTEAAAEKLIVVLGSKGGVGTTTVAVNLAAHMAQVSRKKVGLLDFARPLGHAWLMLGLQPRFSVRNAVEEVERLDSHLLGGLLTSHSSGVQLLAGTSHPDEWERISVPSLLRVANVAQSACDFVVTDLGSQCSSEWSPILRLAHLVILVSVADVPGLWALERQLAGISSLNLGAHRLCIVVNRWHRDDEEGLKMFEKRSKRSVSVRLPNDYQQVSEAVNRGAILSRNHNDPLVSRFRSLAGELTGLQIQGEKRGTILGLFSGMRRLPHVNSSHEAA